LVEASKPLARAIPPDHQNVLIKAGLAKRATGGFMLTDMGKAAATVARDTPHVIDSA